MSAILHRVLDAPLPTVVKGEGPYLYDSDGKRYYDACGGAAVSCLGHNHPKVTEAIREQVGKIAFAHTSFFTNEPAEKLAEHLLDRAPEGFGRGAVMFLGSGSEAMEAALKLSLQYWREMGRPHKTKFISRDKSYHGNSLGALAVSGHIVRREPYRDVLMDVGRIPACYAYREKLPGETDIAYGRRVADVLGDEINRLGAENVAAFVAETVSGATLGCVAAVEGYFKRIREICDQYDVLLIADEVMCGMGRCGTLFAVENEGVCPDIITIAKGLGAGYQPIAATIATEKVTSALRDGTGGLAHGHTYMSHAVACAGCLAVLETFEEENLLEAVQQLGCELEGNLRNAFGQHAHVGDIRGRGLFWGIEFVRDIESKQPFSRDFKLAERFKARAMEAGLMCYPGTGGADGTNGDHLLLAPTFIATRKQLGDVVSICAEVLEDCLQ